MFLETLMWLIKFPVSYLITNSFDQPYDLKLSEDGIFDTSSRNAQQTSANEIPSRVGKENAAALYSASKKIIRQFKAGEPTNYQSFCDSALDYGFLETIYFFDCSFFLPFFFIKQLAEHVGWAEISRLTLYLTNSYPLFFTYDFILEHEIKVLALDLRMYETSWAWLLKDLESGCLTNLDLLEVKPFFIRDLNRWYSIAEGIDFYFADTHIIDLMSSFKDEDFDVRGPNKYRYIDYISKTEKTQISQGRIRARKARIEALSPKYLPLGPQNKIKFY